MVQFKATKDELETIRAIAVRARQLAKLAGREYPLMDAMMDVEAVHSNGCPLKLDELLTADDVNFSHDVFGIYRHIDRETGQLGDCFLPHYAKPHTA